ncbi:RHS repeat-associated core domain-containing protein [Leptospira perolatii]|uniref:RHS repeat-associated core domain-containing protein n=1 Tax=Leptospira perolatii TaxID=2023191 RepID=UPI001FAE8FCA|nr:RHS repeat-associated core domain-containing protein [Leptospira perolatii]
MSSRTCYYDPQIARFTSADSIIDGEYDTQGWNRFAYVKGNPVGAKDPSGHQSVPCMTGECLMSEIGRPITSNEYVGGIRKAAENPNYQMLKMMPGGGLADYLMQASADIVEKDYEKLAIRSTKVIAIEALGASAAHFPAIAKSFGGVVGRWATGKTVRYGVELSKADIKLALKNVNYNGTEASLGKYYGNGSYKNYTSMRNTKNGLRSYYDIGNRYSQLNDYGRGALNRIFIDEIARLKQTAKFNIPLNEAGRWGKEEIRWLKEAGYVEKGKKALSSPR